MSTFGGSASVPEPIRRFLLLATIGAGAVACLALAHLARPGSSRSAADAQAIVCGEIMENGEDQPGQLAQCQAQTAHLRALESR